MKRWALLSVLLAARAWADQTPDWLRLPGADPRPARASAWILENAESDREQDDGSVLRRIRFAIMPLTDAGAKHVVVSPALHGGFQQGHVARQGLGRLARCGKKCRQYGGTDFAVMSPSINNLIWDQAKTITFDARRFMQPGWIFASEIEIRSDSSPFDIQWNPKSRFPVHHASLLLVPVAGGSVKWKGPKEVGTPTAGAGGSLAWSLNDIAPADLDVPPALHLSGTELRAYLLTQPAQSKSWADIVRLARAEMDPKAIATPAVAALARREAGGENLWTRIEPACRFVQKEVTYLEVTIDTDSMAGYRPHAAADVCENRYGDCKDKATLLCTMLRTIGVEAYVTLVNSGEPTVNRLGVALGDVQPRHRGDSLPRSAAARLSHRSRPGPRVPSLRPHERSRAARTPAAVRRRRTGPHPRSPHRRRRHNPGSAPRQRNGLGQGESRRLGRRFGLPFEVSWKNGSDTLRRKRIFLRDETPSHAARAGALELRIQRRLPLVSDITWENAFDAPAHTWSTKARFSAQYVGKRIRGGMFVPTDLMSVVPFAAPWDSDSGGWVSVTPGTRIREVEIEAPAGWLVSEVPADWTFKSGAGEGSIRYENQGPAARARMSLTINGGILDRPAYLEYRTLLVAALEAERSPVVLSRPPPTSAPAAVPSSH